MYADEWVRIYQGDAFKVIKRLSMADVVITDPPYGEQTHEGARTGSTKGGTVQAGSSKLVDFKCFTEKDILRLVKSLAAVTRRWLIMTVDDDHAYALKHKTPKGWRFIRRGVWVKRGAAPQFTGDRPAQGWEAIVFLHRDNLAPSWNGGGRNSVFDHQVIHGDHPTQKPDGLISEFIQLFTSPGEVILDPFMGSGTVLKVAKALNRRAVGVDLDPQWSGVALKRLAQGALPLGV